MLAKRIIPTILVSGLNAVKGKQYDARRSIGSAIAIAQVHALRGVDEMIILDVDATRQKRGPDLELVKRLSESCFMPITVGGGVSTLEHIEALLRAGADKVAICTAAHDDPYLSSAAAIRFGSQAIVGVVEYIGQRVTSRCGKYEHHMTPVDWAHNLEVLGAGEILLTSVHHDGMLCGYDLLTLTKVAKQSSVPVIVSGGCGNYQHMVQAFDAGASGCAAGAMFAFEDTTPRAAAAYAHGMGVETRL